MIEDLEALRREIDKIDELILELIGKRLKIAKMIGYIKKARGITLRDLARENEVEGRWISISKGKGIPESLAREISRLLIQHSIAAQASIAPKARRIALIGYGGMARTLGEILVWAGHEVTISGRNSEKASDLARILRCRYSQEAMAIGNSEYIILALSRGAFLDGYVEKLTAYMGDKLVMDILSSKRDIYKKMEDLSKRYQFRYISTHPLFGPTHMPFGESIVLIPSITGRESLEEAIAFWSSAGLSPIISSYDEHEKAMAMVQVIPHIYILALAYAINILSKRYGIDYRGYRTYSFKKIEEVIRRISDNIDAVAEIQLNNEYAREARRIAIETLESTVKSFGW